MDQPTQPIPSNSHIYLIIILLLSVLGVGGVIFISVFNPTSDNTLIIATIIGLITPIIFAILALMQKDTHDINNSRLTELLDISKKAAKAEGKLEGPTVEVVVKE